MKESRKEVLERIQQADCKKEMSEEEKTRRREVAKKKEAMWQKPQEFKIALEIKGDSALAVHWLNGL